jgi:hypothetical protein
MVAAGNDERAAKTFASAFVWRKQLNQSFPPPNSVLGFESWMKQFAETKKLFYDRSCVLCSATLVLLDSNDPSTDGDSTFALIRCFKKRRTR